ncbi:MAG TPA: CdaR family protein [Acidobacteriota bacterium]|nr:CdaR family protein [Acidobacteriota bacterium]
MRLLDNFWLKLIALLMGFLVWLHVATEKTYNYELKLPVNGVILKDSLTLLREPPDSLLVAVSANGKKLLREKWRERGVRINATGFPAGRYNITLTPANTFLVSPSGDISLDEVVLPREIQLHIDHLEEVSLPVTPDITAQADDGFAISRIYVSSPENVTLSGPRTTLGRFTSVFTEKKQLTSLRNSISLTMAVMSPPGHGYTVRPDSVTLEIEVVPVKTRVYSALPIVVYNAPPGQAVLTDPATVDIELTGPPEDIDLLNRNALTVSVDFRRLDAAGYTAVKIDCPSNFRVKKSSIDSTRVILGQDADTRD